MIITIQLGKTTGAAKPVHWTSKLNAHLNISGQSGQRKTTFLRNLICQLADQNVHVVVVDCAGDFCDPTVTYPAAWPPKGHQIVHIRSKHAPISSMSPWPLPSGGYESANQLADRVAGILQKALRLGAKQWAYLYQIIKEGCEENGTVTMAYLMERIEADAFAYPEAESLQSRLAALNDFPETEDDCLEAFKEPGVTVIDAQDLRSTTLRSLVTEILLGNLWAYKLSNKESCPLIVVLDECQHLRFDDDSMAQTILREGRKYDLAGWFSSQWMDNATAVRALSQAALQICFRPDDWAVAQTARRLTQGNPKQQAACKRELMRLHPGQFFFLQNGHPIKVDGNTSPKDAKPQMSQFIPSCPANK